MNSCKDCYCSFDSLEACLRHEILEHLNLNLSTKKELRRQAIYEVLRNSERGKELEALIKLFYVEKEQVENIKQTICGDLNEALAEPKVLMTYGSLVSGLMMKDSDVDIFVVKTEEEPKNDKLKLMEQLALELRRSKKFYQVILVSKARVPIIKCLHTASQLKVDINCFSGECVANSIFFKKLFDFDVRLRTFARFMKIWFKQWHLIGQGLITSYCFATLLLFFLQRMQVVPSVQRLQYFVPVVMVNGANHAFDLINQMQPLPVALSAHHLIRDFFVFFKRFQFEGNIISTYLGKSVPASKAKVKKFLLKGPNMTEPKAVSFKLLQTGTPLIVHDCFQVNLNIAKGVLQSHLERFRNCVETAAAICDKMANSPKSDLYEALLYGNL